MSKEFKGLFLERNPKSQIIKRDKVMDVLIRVYVILLGLILFSLVVASKVPILVENILEK